jgi:hypothetical protein
MVEIHLVPVSTWTDQEIFSAWLGGTDQAVEGDWRWLDGTPITLNTSIWHQGEPNNVLTIPEGEDCMIFLSNITSLDLPCDMPRPAPVGFFGFRALCQRDL